MPNLSIVSWEIRRTAGGRIPERTCPRCRRTGEWSAVHERRRLRVMGTGVGRASGRDLMACRACGCALPAGWRAAQDQPSPRLVSA